MGTSREDQLKSQKEALQKAARFASKADTSGLSSTARIMKALSNTQRLVANITKEAKAHIITAIKAEADAASIKSTLISTPPVALETWQAAAKDIATTLSNDRKTQGSGEELNEALSPIEKKAAEVHEKRQQITTDIKNIIAKLNVKIPELVKMLEELGENKPGTDVDAKIKEIEQLDNQTISKQQELEKLFKEEAQITKEFEASFNKGNDILLNQQLPKKIGPTLTS